jgi:formate hydrogenlyase subunit 3/multisubunit Na+/H+ antiporter MnhD subunit
MDFGYLIVWLLCVVGLSFFLIPLLSERRKSFGALILVGINVVITSFIAIEALFYNGIEVVFNGGIVFGDIPVRIDALSAWFMLIINFTAFNGAWYGISYTKHVSATPAQRSLHWVLFVLFHASMLGVCMVQNSFAFLIVWEIMSISSLLLVLFDYSNPKTLHAGLNYLIQMHVGVALITVAFIISYYLTGSLDFKTFVTTFALGNGKWLFIVLFIGFGIKAGFIPLHTWLPHAHPAAPSHVSGVMSGVIVKLGIYGILRMITFLTTNLILLGEVILIISVLTSFYGIFNAAIHRDFKKMLAYCTIENIGIIGMGIGLGLIGHGIDNSFIEFIGFAGALLHVLNHALYKSLLFFSAGNVYIQTHTRNMEQLGGLIKNMPSTAFFFLCGSLAICGLPPFNGFVSEFLIYSGLIEGIRLDNIQFSALMIICISILAIVGGLSLLTFTKTFGTIFLGSARKEITHQPEEVSKFTLIPLVLILAVMMVIGLFPSVIISPLTRVVAVFCPTYLPDVDFGSTLNILSNVGIASVGFVSLILIIYFVKKRTEKKHEIVVGPTWGCGYLAPTSKIQYTSKSYSRGLAKLFNFMTLEKKKYREIETANIFPKYRSFQSYFLDIFEIKIIQRLIHLLLRFTDYFSFIHNGKIQLYILYGVFFILSLILVTFFNVF